ncbi:MAG: carboxypeptidase regulatory-like domain-containing protein [Calditrichaeota bacterium]|nr:carboxypeptidase regulatory-like domain-containing protein [Calditrichota bacterium]
MLKKIAISMVIPALLATFTGPCFALTQQAGLNSGQGNIANVVYDSPSSIRINFTPPPSSTLLISDYSSSGETAYNLSEGFLSSDNKRLPAVTYWVTVPPQSHVELQIISQNGRRLSSDGEFLSDFALDETSDAYSLQAFKEYNPPRAASMGRPQVMRGVRMVPVTIYPLQIDQGNALAIENSKITVDLKMSHGDAVNPVTNPRPANFSSGFAKIFESISLNPPQNLNPRRDLADTALSRLLILYPEALNEDDEDEDAEEAVTWIHRYANLKRRMGYLVNVEFVDTDNRDSDFIKNQIIRHYYEEVDPPVEFVTIIGNENWIELNSDSIENRNPELYFPSFDIVIVVEEIEYIVRSEHGYTTLEGDEDDEVPDIILSRMKVPNYQSLIGVLQKTIEYQTDPYVENEDWFSHALVTVEPDTLPALPIVYFDLAYWEANRLRQKGYNDVDVMIDGMEDMADDVKAIFEEGVSIALGEGMLYGCVQGSNWEQWDEENVARTGKMNSFNIANVSNYMHEVMYPFFSSALPDEINGCIAGMGIYDTFAHAALMTPIIGSALTAMVYDDVYIPGYLQLITKLYLLGLTEREGLSEFYAPELLESYRLHWTLGDPTVDIYSELPVQLEMDYNEHEIQIGLTSFVVEVTAEDETVSDVVVCIRQPQEEGIQYVMNTNADGVAAFTIPDGLEEGELDITAYKHNYIAYLETIEVERGEINLILADYGFDDSEFGDDDGVFRNDEVVRLLLSLTNNGEADAQGVIANLSCDSEWLYFEANEIEFDLIHPDETVAYGGNLFMELIQSCPHGTILRIQADIRHDEEFLTSVAFEIETGGPSLSVDSLGVDDAEFIPGGQDIAFSPVIANNGQFGISDFRATLESLDERVEIVAAERGYDAIDVDRVGNPADPFLLSIDSLFVPGNAVAFQLLISNENDGYEDTLEFSKIVIPREAGEPQGPDDYGYLCFDSMDTTWLEAPVYDWREISWEIEDWEFRGEQLDMNLDIDSTTVLDLPFAFQYYGEQFENILVNTNGWAAFGTELEEVFESTYNRPIPGYGAPDGQLCILWQQIFDDGGHSYDGIYYHYIEEEGIFVIEWSQVQLQHVVEEEEDPLYFSTSFQILLFDPEIYQTPTGDGGIVFQYKEYFAATGNHHDIRYATIGIRNLTGDGGLQYSYWNELSDQAHPISDEFAIKFTTAAQNDYGNVTGRVVRASDENVGIAGINIANVRQHRDIETNEQGYFTIENLRIGAYEGIIVSGEGYNTVTLSFDVEADRETDLGNITLTHPVIEIVTSPYPMVPNETTRWSLRPDGTELQLEFEISNHGDGALEYSTTIVNEDGSESDYSNVESFQLSDLLDHGRWWGLTYIDSLFYIPGNDDQQIHVVSKTGQLIRRFDQPEFVSDDGFQYMTFDGEHLWGNYYDFRERKMRLVSIDFNGNLVSEIELQGPDFLSIMPIEFIPERNTFFLAKRFGSEIYEINREGNIVNEYSVHFPGVTPRISGLTWNSYDPDGMNLYLIDWNAPYPGWQPPDDTLKMRLIKMNPETGDWRFLTMLEGRSNSSGSYGMILMNNHNIINRTMIAVIDKRPTRSNDDFLRIYDMGPNLTFIADTVMSNRNGIIEPDGSINVGMLIATTTLPDVEIPFGIKFMHNADGEDILYPILLHITDTTGTNDRNGELKPVDFRITNVSPNPFNASVRINFTIDRNEHTVLRLYDLVGREVAVIYEGVPEVGSHSLTWNGGGMPSGVYFLRLEMEGRARTVKTAILK